MSAVCRVRSRVAAVALFGYALRFSILYSSNTNRWRRLAGTAGESARTTHVYRSVARAHRQHIMQHMATCAHDTRRTRGRQRHARATTTRRWPAATGAPRHAPLTTPRQPLRQPRAKRALLALRPATSHLRTWASMRACVWAAGSRERPCSPAERRRAAAVEAIARTLQPQAKRMKR